MCDWEIVDLFVTNDTQEANEKKEEDWQGAVWSVEVHDIAEDNNPAATSANQNTGTTIKTAAFVANWETNWVMTCDKTWPMKGLEVGDTVRIGTSEAGHTNHRVVLEKRKIDVIYSGINKTGSDTRFAHGDLKMITGTKAEISMGDHSTGTTDSHFIFTTLDRPSATNVDLPFQASARKNGSTFGNYHGPDVVTTPRNFGFDTNHSAMIDPTDGLDVRADPIYAYRINARMNATDPPIQFNYRHIDNLPTTYKQSQALLDNRHLLQLNTDWAYQDQKGDRTNVQFYFVSGTNKVTLTEDGFMLRRKQLPQPLYRTRRYTDSPSKSLQVDLDTGMKAMKWLKLMAYSMYGKQRVGVADTHEYGHQDWVAMSIDQINGKIISNNPYAQNAFYVLHGGTATEDEMGTIEIHERSDTALVTHEFQPEQALKQLNFRFTNREGEPSKFNRIHLWFKACVKRS